MSVVDLKELIYNRKKCYDLYMIRGSEPECQINLVNDMFYYLPTGHEMVQSIEENNNFLGGIVKGNYIKFNYQKRIFAEYKYGKALNYIYLPNHFRRGVAIAKISSSKNENFLISSGQLSGCTVCSMYVKEFNRIYFFHVGKAYSIDNQDYPQNLKNIDLYNSIAIAVDEDIINVQLLTDEQLLYNLYKLLNTIDYTIQINIFIRADDDNIHSLNCKSISLKTINSGIYLRYYNSHAQMLTTMCKNQLYSVHYFVLSEYDKPYHEIKRKNYIIQP